MVSRQHPRSTRLLVVVLVSISLAVITLDYREGEDGPLAGLGRIALATMAPLQEAVTTATRPIGDFFSGLVHLPSLEEENERLRRENQELSAAIAAAADKESQIEQLSNLLELAGEPDTGFGPRGRHRERPIELPLHDHDQQGVASMASRWTSRWSPDPSRRPSSSGGWSRVSAISAEVQLIIDRNSVVAGRLSVSHETGQIQGQGDQDLRMTLVTPGTSVTGDETVVTQGYEVNGQQGLYPPGLVIGQVSACDPRRRRAAGVRHRPTGDRLLHAGVRAGAADVPERRLSVLRRTLALAAVIVTALLLQSTVFSQIKLLGVTARAAVRRHDLDGDPRGPERGRDRRVRRRHGAGLPARPAEGDHRA